MLVDRKMASKIPNGEVKKFKYRLRVFTESINFFFFQINTVDFFNVITFVNDQTYLTMLRYNSGCFLQDQSPITISELPSLIDV